MGVQETPSRYMKQFHPEGHIERIRDVVKRCAFQEYVFDVHLDGRGEIFLQASYLEPDTVTGVIGTQLTRRWFISPHMTDSEIVRTAFKCIITSMEHRAREWFTYRGRAIFGPHFDVEALHAVCGEKHSFDHREE
jgi:hypothetical protein